VGPENVLSEQIELEVLLSNKIKTMETELTECRKALLESRNNESEFRSQIISSRSSLELNAQHCQRY
jgi:hypothetical protein